MPVCCFWPPTAAMLAALSLPRLAACFEATVGFIHVQKWHLISLMVPARAGSKDWQLAQGSSYAHVRCCTAALVSMLP